MTNALLDPPVERQADQEPPYRIAVGLVYRLRYTRIGQPTPGYRLGVLCGTDYGLIWVRKWLNAAQRWSGKLKWDPTEFAGYWEGPLPDQFPVEPPYRILGALGLPIVLNPSPHSLQYLLEARKEPAMVISGSQQLAQETQTPAAQQPAVRLTKDGRPARRPGPRRKEDREAVQQSLPTTSATSAVESAVEAPRAVAEAPTPQPAAGVELAGVQPANGVAMAQDAQTGKTHVAVVIHEMRVRGIVFEDPEAIITNIPEGVTGEELEATIVAHFPFGEKNIPMANRKIQLGLRDASPVVQRAYRHNTAPRYDFWDLKADQLPE